MQKVISIASILLVIVFCADAQSFYAARRERSLILTGGIGTSSYQGELTNTRDVYKAKPALSVGLQYYINNVISLRTEASWFQFKGDDALAPIESGRQPRNLSFKSDNFEANFTGHISLLPQGRRFYQRPNINLYGFLGVGFLYFNPKAEYQGETYALQPLRTELVDYSRFAFVVPFGLGTRFKIGPFFNLAIEGGLRKTFTDYIDDVSTVHVDPAAFTDPIAAALSDRGPEVGAKKAEPGSIRGNPSTDDWYFILSAKVEYYLPTNFGGNNQKYTKKKRSAYYRYNKKGGMKRKR